MILENNPKNIVSYCIRCGSILYWDSAGRPRILKLGNNRLVTCLDVGCNLIIKKIPNNADGNSLDILRLALVESGVPADDARSAVVNLAISHGKMPMA